MTTVLDPIDYISELVNSIIPMHVHILLGLIRTYARIVCLGLDR